MRQALIFDVDGTLWDTTYQLPLLYNEMFKKLGFTEKCIDRKTVMDLWDIQRKKLRQSFSES